VEIRIGIKDSNRDVALETNESHKEVLKLVEAAIANSSLLNLTDDKGRTVLVPGGVIAFVEIGSPTSGRVGFASA
jgi:hypothetical protein